MTQRFDENGRVIPVTLVEATPNVVAGIKTVERDGYSAVVLGFEEQKESRVNKAQLSAFGGKGYKTVKEFRTENVEKNIGDTISVDNFIVGDNVTVTSTSKSKGFQGVVKRHNFAGGLRTHGQKHSEREPGSIGGGGRAGGRVVKGMRMAGRMGGDTVTVKGLKVVSVDTDKNIIAISGAIPGRRGTVVQIIG